VMICSGVCRLLPIMTSSLTSDQSRILTSALISFQGVTPLAMQTAVSATSAHPSSELPRISMTLAAEWLPVSRSPVGVCATVRAGVTHTIDWV